MILKVLNLITDLKVMILISIFFLLAQMALWFLV